MGLHTYENHRPSPSGAFPQHHDVHLLATLLKHLARPQTSVRVPLLRVARGQ